MTMPYAVLNDKGECVNRILWDGQAPWQPPENCTVVPDPDNQYPLYSAQREQYTQE